MTERTAPSDFGDEQRDPQQQAEAEVNLDDPSATDDVPWSPPERQPRASELIGEETGEGESLNQRILQEEPDEQAEVPGRPTDREMVGGDDPDAIPADRDVLGGPADPPGPDDLV